MRLGAIDMGTNSVRLLVAEEQGTGLNRIREEIEVPRLGEDINQTGYLKEEAIERTIHVLANYKKIIDDLDATPHLVATSAVRDATNQAEFINLVEQEVGLEVNPVSGSQEAYLSYLGVTSELTDLNGRQLVIDIGGGSTELITGRADDLLTYKSINVGAVRLTEEIGEKITELKTRVSTEFEFLTPDIDQLIGVGGTITTVGAIKLELETYDRSRIQGLELTKQGVEKILADLSELSLTERQQVAGLGPRRADIIIPGIVILLEIMNQIQATKLLISDAGLLEGIIYKNI